ncbi:drosomycin-like [Vespula squamosa]|uniref:Drosomycin-like n=1 Tax=Vespula squamosa TaxID=30214 RepID=A0ABD2AS28_VESSQ
MDTGHPYEYIRTCKKSKRHDLTPVGLQQSIKMAKIYFLAFLALLVFVAVSAQEEQEQEKGTVLDVQLQNPEEYGWPCSAGGSPLCKIVLDRQLEDSEEYKSICESGGHSACNKSCKSAGMHLGICNRNGVCICL